MAESKTMFSRENHLMLHLITSQIRLSSGRLIYEAPSIRFLFQFPSRPLGSILYMPIIHKTYDAWIIVFSCVRSKKEVEWRGKSNKNRLILS